MKKPQPSPQEAINRQIRRKTIRAFALFGAAALLPPALFKWVQNQPRDQYLRRPLRKILEQNGQLAQTYYSQARLAPEFDKSQASPKPRLNGKEGLKTPISLQDWQLHIESDNGSKSKLLFEDILRLPKHEIVFEFKCIEGWSQVMHYSGARLSELMSVYHLGTQDGSLWEKTKAENLYDYVGLSTPDGKYFVGLDMESALHPQTLLCYELNGKPLPQEHGFPLRLIIPVKYGIKNLKRIGTIRFTNNRPPDYWANYGYDYHAGL
jgi:DMSO/TMAO reductase YedYZ molybdopterin-dependent catalytic subunit